MDRTTFLNSRGKTLVGNFYPTDSNDKDALVIMTHGLINDKSSQGRFELYANALVSAGIAVLTFDFSGCGESDDETLTIDKERDDLRSVILSMRSQGFHNMGLYGHSVGSLICLKVYSPEFAADIQTIAMTGGFTGPVHFKWEDIFNADQMQELLETGVITADTKSQHREKVVIHGQTLNDFALINQRELLSYIKCPVLMIHGDGDKDERTLYQLSQGGMNFLPPGSELKLISGATHNFAKHDAEIAEMLKSWFTRYLIKNNE